MAEINVSINNGTETASSYFDGSLATFIGVQLLGFLVTAVTLGICYPWAVCRTYRWRTEHTIINGHRLKFIGTATGLFGKWIVWLLLSIITIGIYSFWVGIALEKWKVKNTVFAN